MRFELTDPFEPPVFKTGAIDHSATLPAGGIVTSFWAQIGAFQAGRAKINVDLTPFKLNEHALGFDVSDDVGQAGLGFEVGHDEGFEAFGGGAHAGGVGMHHV